jgi:hypothetical protein
VSSECNGSWKIRWLKLDEMRLFTIINGFYLIAILFAFNCRGVKNKDKIVAVIPICDRSLFMVTYEVNRGSAYDGDIISAYITDSSSFRKYIGTYDNAHEGFDFYCNHDSITVYRMKREPETNKYFPFDSTQYNLVALKKQKLFE